MPKRSLLRSSVASVLIMLGCAGTAHAGAAAGGATEWTQILNNVQLLEQSGQGVRQIANQATQIAHQVTQIQNQLNQYRTMLQNLEKLPDSIWGQAQQDLSRLQSLVQQGQGISFSMGSLDDVLKDRFRSYAEFQTEQMSGEQFSDMYQSWSDTNRDTIGGTLRGAGLTAEQFATEQTTMQQLQRQSETSIGQMQALQVGHSIAGQQVEQMQKLRGLISQQTTMMGTWYQSEQALRDHTQAENERFFGGSSGVSVGNETTFSPQW